MMVCLVILIASSFLQFALAMPASSSSHVAEFKIFQQLSDGHKSKISGKTFDVDKLKKFAQTISVEKLKEFDEPSHAEKLKIYEESSYTGISENSAKSQNSKEKTNNMGKRVRRSYGQKSKCSGSKNKKFCKAFTINNVTKKICFTFKSRRCVGLD